MNCFKLFVIRFLLKSISLYIELHLQEWDCHFVPILDRMTLSKYVQKPRLRSKLALSEKSTSQRKKNAAQPHRCIDQFAALFPELGPWPEHVDMQPQSHGMNFFHTVFSFGHVPHDLRHSCTTSNTLASKIHNIAVPTSRSCALIQKLHFGLTKPCVFPEFIRRMMDD